MFKFGSQQCRVQSELGRQQCRFQSELGSQQCRVQSDLGSQQCRVQQSLVNVRQSTVQSLVNVRQSTVQSQAVNNVQFSQKVQMASLGLYRCGQYFTKTVQAVKRLKRVVCQLYQLVSLTQSLIQKLSDTSASDSFLKTWRKKK